MQDKPLSDKQAQACENAIGKVCRCRCGGALHGRAAGGTSPDGSIDRAYFENLPADDPHHLPTAEEKAQARAERAEQRKQQKQAERAERDRKRAAMYERLYSNNPRDPYSW